MIDRWVIYLEIIRQVVPYGRPLKDLEDHLMEEFNMGLSMARYYITRMRKAGWIRYTRPYRTSKKIRVEPTRKLKEWVLDICEPKE